MSIDNRVKAIVIPTGREKQDIRRAKKAIKYKRETGFNVPYIV